MAENVSPDTPKPSTGRLANERGFRSPLSLAHAIGNPGENGVQWPRAGVRACRREAEESTSVVVTTAVNGSARPLCVDLDGTLVGTDLLWESLLVLAKNRPSQLIRLPLWLVRGKAHFKRSVAERVTLNPKSLPFRADVLAFLAEERRAGRPIVLATSADERIARTVADHVGLFDDVIASDGVVNLSGAAKAQKLTTYSGSRGFDYIGNSKVDLAVWQAARRAHLVDPAPGLLRRAVRVAQVRLVFHSPPESGRPVLRALRLHQWVKNLLLLGPLVLSHQVTNATLLFQAVCAFLVFGLCASGAYIVNDLLDLEADRLHPSKRNRPFAAAALSIPSGMVLAATLIGFGILFSALVLPLAFMAVITVYLMVAAAYSLFIKRLVLLDVFVLAGLYTLRVVAGGIAVGVSISPWLYAFSMFLFTSLAFVKRYAELQRLAETYELAVNGRSYVVGDLAFLRSVGPTCGLIAMLVLALYVNSQEVLHLYRSPELLWLAIGPLTYWVTHVWFVAHRGRMADDPIVFTFKDPTSYLVGVCVAAVMIVASF